ncbi:MAG: prepilin peptidase [Perlucidibaca sp.]
MLTCAVCDWRTRRIPNVLSLGFLLLAGVCLLAFRQALAGGSPAAGFAGMAAALLMTLPGFVLGRLGGGDVKLLAALGLATNPALVLVTFVLATAVLLLSALAARAGLRVSSAGADGQAANEWPFGPCLLLGYLGALALLPYLA